MKCKFDGLPNDPEDNFEAGIYFAKSTLFHITQINRPDLSCDRKHLT